MLLYFMYHKILIVTPKVNNNYQIPWCGEGYIIQNLQQKQHLNLLLNPNI